MTSRRSGSRGIRAAFHLVERAVQSSPMPMKIRAALLVAPKQPFVVETLELDEPRRGEVLVKLAACGVCHSDWHLVTGDTKHPMPVVAGHEGAGVVEAV